MVAITVLDKRLNVYSYAWSDVSCPAKLFAYQHSIREYEQINVKFVCRVCEDQSMLTCIVSGGVETIRMSFVDLHYIASTDYIEADNNEGEDR